MKKTGRLGVQIIFEANLVKACEVSLACQILQSVAEVFGRKKNYAFGLFQNSSKKGII
jgi:hypothetical protein